MRMSFLGQSTNDDTVSSLTDFIIIAGANQTKASIWSDVEDALEKVFKTVT